MLQKCLFIPMERDRERERDIERDSKKSGYIFCSILMES